MLQGTQLSDSVLGVTTPGRFAYTGGVYYYNNLTSTQPVTSVISDSDLGLTRGPSVRAAVGGGLDTPLDDSRNVPNSKNTIYGWYIWLT